MSFTDERAGAGYFDYVYRLPKTEMTLPSKNSRAIVVDAVRFRYIVAKSGVCDKGLFSLNLTVQIANGRGSILKAHGIELAYLAAHLG
jgi:hypothetical protein